MSLAAMANVSLVVVLFFFIFAILGVQVRLGRVTTAPGDISKSRLGWGGGNSRNSRPLTLLACTPRLCPLLLPSPQLFGGKFWSCNDDSVPDVTACTGNFTDPATNQVGPGGGRRCWLWVHRNEVSFGLHQHRLVPHIRRKQPIITPDSLTKTWFHRRMTTQTVPREWSNAAFNFDHLGMGMMSLFVVATLNGYSEIMDSGGWRALRVSNDSGTAPAFTRPLCMPLKRLPQEHLPRPPSNDPAALAAMAAPEEKGMQPVPMSNAGALLYFVAFVVVVSYTLINLYIGVVFFQFSRIRQQSVTGSAFLTNEQQEWAELSKMVFRLKPPDKCPVPRNRFRR
jgi:hypothetical protein